jgi:hypothetical protein
MAAAKATSNAALKVFITRCLLVENRRPGRDLSTLENAAVGAPGNGVGAIPTLSLRDGRE